MAIELTADETMTDAIYSVRMEGLEIAPEDRAILERIVRGEITRAEACAQIIANAQARERGGPLPFPATPLERPQEQGASAPYSTENLWRLQELAPVRPRPRDSLHGPEATEMTE